MPLIISLPLAVIPLFIGGLFGEKITTLQILRPSDPRNRDKQSERTNRARAAMRWHGSGASRGWLQIRCKSSQPATADAMALPKTAPLRAEAKFPAKSQKFPAVREFRPARRTGTVAPACSVSARSRFAANPLHMQQKQPPGAVSHDGGEARQPCIFLADSGGTGGIFPLASRGGAAIMPVGHRG